MNTFNHQSGDYLNIGTAKIYYEKAGTPGKPVLLILHGGLGTMNDTSPIHTELAKQFTLLGIDGRGQGKSTIGEEPLTYEHLQQDVEAVLTHIKIDEFSILGFSDGGIVAYRLAAFTNLNIKQVATIGSTWHNKNMLPQKPIYQKLSAQSWAAKFPETVESYNNLNPEADFTKLVNAIKHMWMDETESGHPNEAVKNIKQPVLIARGDKDHLTTLADVAELETLVKNASVFIVPFAQHDAYVQQPELLKMVLTEFFKC
nr:alpha/beta hydrolase [uncultured Mucilaginibacter sp.]